MPSVQLSSDPPAMQDIQHARSVKSWLTADGGVCEKAAVASCEDLGDAQNRSGQEEQGKYQCSHICVLSTTAVSENLISCKKKLLKLCQKIFVSFYYH